MASSEKGLKTLRDGEEGVTLCDREESPCSNSSKTKSGRSWGVRGSALLTQFPLAVGDLERGNRVTPTSSNSFCRTLNAYSDVRQVPGVSFVGASLTCSVRLCLAQWNV